MGTYSFIYFMDRLTNIPSQPEDKEQNPKFVEKAFADEASAVQFIKDFWMAVDPENVGERIVNWDATRLREYTNPVGDKTTLQGLTVSVYNYKGGEFTLSNKATEFLKSGGLI